MFFLGIDVAKAKFDCCLFYQGSEGKKKDKTFTNNPEGFTKLLKWLEQQGCALTETHAVMEATSVYHELLAYALFDAGLLVSIANPANVRNLANALSMRNKTDKADSEVLARFAIMTEPNLWQPPSPQARLLQALLTRRNALLADLLRERNRLEKATSTTTPPRILASINSSITFLEKEIAQLDQDTSDHIDQYPKLKSDMKLLTSITAIGKRTGTMMLSLLHNHEFERAEQVAAYVGLVPVQHQSGSSIQGKSRLSKAGSGKVRAGLYMAAVVAIQHNPHIKAMYERLLAKGKTKMCALGAAMRKLVHICFGVLKNQTPYQSNYLPKLA